MADVWVRMMMVVVVGIGGRPVKGRRPARRYRKLEVNVRVIVLSSWFAEWHGLQAMSPLRVT